MGLESKNVRSGSRAMFATLIEQLASERPEIDERLLRVQEYLLADLEIFQDLLDMCKANAKTDFWWEDDPEKEKFIRVALRAITNKKLSKRIIKGGFVSLLRDLDQPPATTIVLRQELIALLIVPEKLALLRSSIFLQANLPPNWTSALQKGSPKRKT